MTCLRLPFISEMDGHLLSPFGFDSLFSLGLALQEKEKKENVLIRSASQRLHTQRINDEMCSCERAPEEGEKKNLRRREMALCPHAFDNDRRGSCSRWSSLTYTQAPQYNLYRPQMRFFFLRVLLFLLLLPLEKPHSIYTSVFAVRYKLKDHFWGGKYYL